MGTGELSGNLAKLLEGGKEGRGIKPNAIQEGSSQCDFAETGILSFHF